MNEFYRFRCEAAEGDEEPTAAEQMIFSQVGEWDDMGDVSARAFARDLGKLSTSVKTLNIHINSPGGSVFEAQGIYSRLADHRSTKHVYVDGLAASAASIIAMVGHKIYIRANANMMVHLPSGLAAGNADDMRHMATALDAITESMINVYQKRTNLDRKEIRDMLAAETWMSPQQAVEKGFADEVRGVVKAAAVIDPKRVIINGVEMDLSRFRNVPAFTAQTTSTIEVNNMPEPQKPTPTPTPTPEPTPTPAPEPPKPTAAAPTPPGDPPKPAPTAADAVATERARVAALMSMDRPATHKIVTAAIADGRTVADIAAECMTAMDAHAGLDKRRADAAILDGIPPSDPTGSEENPFGALITENVKSVMKARGRRSPMNSRN